MRKKCRVFKFLIVVVSKYKFFIINLIYNYQTTIFAKLILKKHVLYENTI
jgi:hypothetical protein